MLFEARSALLTKMLLWPSKAEGKPPANLMRSALVSPGTPDEKRVQNLHQTQSDRSTRVLLACAEVELLASSGKTTASGIPKCEQVMS